MSESYLNLKKRCDELTKENNQLKLELTENFMIQSMNDMKKMYEEKEALLEFYTKKCDKMTDINFHLTENIRAINIMISTLRNESKKKSIEIDLKLKFMEEVIYNCLQIKNELMYTD